MADNVDENYVDDYDGRVVGVDKMLADSLAFDAAADAAQAENEAAAVSTTTDPVTGLNIIDGDDTTAGNYGTLPEPPPGAAPSAIAVGLSDAANNIISAAGGALSGVADKISSSLSSAASSVSSLFDSGAARKSTLPFLASKQDNPSVTFKEGSSAGSKTINPSWRVKVSVSESVKIFDNKLLKPLATHRGVVFPYLPTIGMSYKANYGSMQLTHSNYKHFTYEGSEVSEITIEGDFPVQNKYEGQYLMAAIQFFRTVTKMYYGSKSPLKGNPPPLVFLDGLGEAYLPHLSCIVTAFSHTLPNDVDYVEVPVYAEPTGPVRLPTLSKISLTLQPVYSKNVIYNNFSLNDFAAGKLVTKDKGGFI